MLRHCIFCFFLIPTWNVNKQSHIVQFTNLIYRSFFWLKNVLTWARYWPDTWQYFPSATRHTALRSCTPSPDKGRRHLWMHSMPRCTRAVMTSTRTATVSDKWTTPNWDRTVNALNCSDSRNDSSCPCVLHSIPHAASYEVQNNVAVSWTKARAVLLNWFINFSGSHLKEH